MNPSQPPSPRLPVIAGHEITMDQHGRFNLNAIHKASGEGSHKRPSKWLATLQAQELIQQLESKSPNSGFKEIESRKGRHGGTFAHELLAVSYAGWISRGFQLQVNQVFLDYRMGRLPPPELITREQRLDELAQRIAALAQQRPDTGITLDEATRHNLLVLCNYAIRLREVYRQHRLHETPVGKKMFEYIIAGSCIAKRHKADLEREH